MIHSKLMKLIVAHLIIILLASSLAGCGRTPEPDDKDEEENDGKWIHKERYSGSCMRQFYVGDGLAQEDVKAEFKRGILKLTVPKKEALPDRTQNKYIAIEG